MESFVDVFTSPYFLILCFGAYLLTYVIRTIFESIWKNVSENKLWREVFLPLGPIVNGALIAYFAKMFPFPLNLATSGAGRVMYGAMCGALSALVYNRIKSFIGVFFEEKIDEMESKITHHRPDGYN